MGMVGDPLAFVGACRALQLVAHLTENQGNEGPTVPGRHCMCMLGDRLCLSREEARTCKGGLCAV